MSESPIITFARAFILLAVLVALPGIAICWNHLPKSETLSKPTEPKTEITQHFHSDTEKTRTKPTQNASVFAPESVYPALPEALEADVPTQNSWTSHNATVQQVSWEQPSSESPQNYEALVKRLNALGATSCRVEPWGNRGELFRCSCFAIPSESHAYKKHFQSIDTDVITVMQTVIAEIEQWKNIR